MLVTFLRCMCLCHEILNSRAINKTKLAGQGGFVDYETIFRYFLQELKVVMPVI